MIPNWILKLVGKYVKGKINLQEGLPMENKKPFWKSKTVWSDVVTIVMGVYSILQAHYLPNLPDIPAWVLTFLGGLGIYGRVTATDKIGG